MKRFFDTIRHIFAIEELRTRIINTILFLMIFRVGSFVALPGVNPNSKILGQQQGILDFLDSLVGGAFSNASIFALGIMPYISASIAIQLLTVAVPYFQKLQKEGESGRKKITQITRVLTIIITLGQSIGYVKGTLSPNAIMMENQTLFLITSMIILTAGTVFCMWLGEKITDKGIGNGISMLIMVGIVSRLPGAVYNEVKGRWFDEMLLFVFELGLMFVIIMGVVMLTQAVRKIPVQYAKQLVGNAPNVMGQRQFIPLKVNASGVMPIIFAQAIMYLPAMVASPFQQESKFAASLINMFSPDTWQYSLVLAILIIVFTFFYTAISINPTQIADDMKRNGGFIPGVKPGAYTAEYIDTILSRITLPGALALAAVAVLPVLVNMTNLNVDKNFAQFFGGTSLLILVGVVLDTLQQVESYLLMRHYDGLMKTGKVRSRVQGHGAAI